MDVSSSCMKKVPATTRGISLWSSQSRSLSFAPEFPAVSKIGKGSNPAGRLQPRVSRGRVSCGTMSGIDAEALMERAAESALVLRAQEGDFDAFDQLVRSCERRVWTVAWRMLGEREETENVVQTAFLKAMEALPTFRGESSFCTWVGRIATRSALDVLRSRRRERSLSLDEIASDDDEAPVPHPELLVDWREDPTSGIERQEVRDILDRAIATLPDSLRSVFVLRDVQDLDTAQTAAELGITPGNVKVRLLRARLRLREELTRAFGGEAMVHGHMAGAGTGGLAAAAEVMA